MKASNTGSAFTSRPPSRVSFATSSRGVGLQQLVTTRGKLGGNDGAGPTQSDNARLAVSGQATARLAWLRDFRGHARRGGRAEAVRQGLRSLPRLRAYPVS